MSRERLRNDTTRDLKTSRTTPAVRGRSASSLSAADATKALRYMLEVDRQKEASTLANEAKTLSVVDRNSETTGESPDLEETLDLTSLAEVDSNEKITSGAELYNLIDEQDARIHLRESQIGALVRLVKSYPRGGAFPAEVNVSAAFKQAKSLYPALADDEIVAVINSATLVEADIARSGELVHVLAVGGQKMEDVRGETATVYTLKEIDKGAMGIIIDGFILRDGHIFPAVLKDPIKLTLPASTDPSYQERRDENTYLAKAYEVEAKNANEQLRGSRPNIARCLLITKPRESGLPLIAYEKVIGPQGYVLKMADFCEDNEVSPSQKFVALSYLGEALHGLHTDPAALAHLDVKLENTVINANGEAVLIDPASMVSAKENIKIETRPDWVTKGKISRQVHLHNITQPFHVGLTPGYTDVAQLDEALRAAPNSKNITIADRRALGVALIYALQYANIISFPAQTDPSTVALFSVQEIAAWVRESPMKFALSLSDEEFPTASLKDMIDLACELIDIKDGDTTTPLDVIAGDIRAIATKFTADLDPLHKRYVRLQKQLIAGVS